MPLTPVLKANIFADLTELRTVSVALSVQEGEVIHYEQSFKSKLTVNNVMAWGYNDKGTTVRYDPLVAGWVTPAAQRYTSDKMDSQFRIVDIKKSRLNGITPLP